MFRRAVFRLTGLMVLSVVLSGCGGLDGIRGTLIAVEGNHYVLRDARGQERRAWADERTRSDAVKPGNEVRVYVDKDGHAAYIQKLDGEQGGAGSAARAPHR